MTSDEGAGAGFGGDLLRAKIELGRSSLASSSQSFWQHEQLGALYPEYLFHLYTAMKATVPLMEVASKLAQHRSHDEVAELFLPYIQQHIAEEVDHIDWLMDDMESIGMKRKEFINRTPPTSVAQMIGTQHFWVRHIHPATLISYLAVMEGNPMAASSVARFAKQAGIPDNGIRTLIYHAETDQEHSNELFELLNAMPLSSDMNSKLGFNALQAMGQLAQVFDSIIASQPS